MNELFKTTPLSAAQLGVCVGAAMLVLIAVETEKWARRHWRM